MPITRPRTHPKGHNIYSSDEYVVELEEWVNRVPKLQRMRKSDSQVGAVLRLLKLPIRQSDYNITGGQAQIRDFIEWNLMEWLSWNNILRLSLTMLDFGCMAFEKVFGITDHTMPVSEMYYYRKLQFLPHSTIHEIKGEHDGGLNHLLQDPPDEEEEAYGETTEIKAFYLLVHVLDQEGDWYGTAILRNAYGNWKIKDLLMKVDAIKQDRFGVGLPVAWMKQGYTDDDLALVKKSLKNIRSHENGYMIMPPNVEKLEILSPGKETDVIASIKYHDEQITKTVLAQFIDLGTTGSGNRALGEVFVEAFLMSLNALMDNMLETFNNYLIAPLVDLNWGPQKEYPKITARRINITSIMTVVEALEKLSGINFIKSNREDPVHFRKGLGLPITKEEEDIAEGRAEPEPEPAPPTPPTPPAPPDVAGHEHKFVELLRPGQKMMREVKGLELFIDYEGYAEDFDRAERQFIQDGKKIRDKQIKSFTYDMVMRGIPVDKVRPRYVDRYVALLDEYQEQSFMQGGKSVTQEKKAQLSARGIADSEIKLYQFNQIPSEALESIHSSSKVGAQVMTSRTQNLIADLFILYKDQGLSNKEISARIYAQTLGTGDRVIGQEFSRVEHQWGKGRNMVAELDEDVQGGFYSALLDGKACEICLGADTQFNAGHERPFLVDELPQAPNPNCKGGDRCRCIHVYQYFRETGGVSDRQYTPFDPTNFNDPILAEKRDVLIKGNEGKEVFAILNRETGQTVALKAGTRNQVDIKDVYRKMDGIENDKFVMMHNHPGNNGPSSNDVVSTFQWFQLHKSKEHVVTGASRDHWYRLKVNEKANNKIVGAGTPDKIVQEWNELQVQKYQARLARADTFNKDAAWQMSIHDANKEFAKKYGYEYHYQFKNPYTGRTNRG